MIVIPNLNLHAFETDATKGERFKALTGLDTTLPLTFPGWPTSFWEFRRVTLAANRGTLIATTSDNMAFAMRDAQQQFAANPEFRRMVGTKKSASVYVFDSYIVAKDRTSAAAFMNSFLDIIWGVQKDDVCLALVPDGSKLRSIWGTVKSTAEGCVTLLENVPSDQAAATYVVPVSRILYVDVFTTVPEAKACGLARK